MICSGWELDVQCMYDMQRMGVGCAVYVFHIYTCFHMYMSPSFIDSSYVEGATADDFIMCTHAFTALQSDTVGWASQN